MENPGVSHQILHLLDIASETRRDLFEPRHVTAFRLFNGFYEGYPKLVIDIYGGTLVIYNFAATPHEIANLINEVSNYLLTQLPWVQAVVLKTRKAQTLQARQGVLLYGKNTDQRVLEHGLWYAIDLLLNQDASLYLDTRNLRHWAINNLSGKSVLNTFAYTGSLGVAAFGGGANRVVHVDLSRKYLSLAKKTYTFNRFPINNADFQVSDFFTSVSHYKRTGELFDCVFVDPPIYSTTSKGTIDMVSNSYRVINKVRPLVRDGGYLVVINNTLFLSGAEFMQMLDFLCGDGYLFIDSLIPVPADITGYPQTLSGTPPVDPDPFNHPTKIVILRVRRKARSL